MKSNYVNIEFSGFLFSFFNPDIHCIQGATKAFFAIITTTDRIGYEKPNIFIRFNKGIMLYVECRKPSLLNAFTQIIRPRFPNH